MIDKNTTDVGFSKTSVYFKGINSTNGIGSNQVKKTNKKLL